MTVQTIAAEIGLQHEDRQHGLGALYIDDNGNHFRYMQADGAVVADVLYNYRPITWQIEDYIISGTTPASAEVATVCVSPIAITDNYYAWVFVGPGTVTITTAGDVAADAIVYGTGGNGTVDDTADACLLDGLTCPAAITGAVAGTFYAAKALIAIDLP